MSSVSDEDLVGFGGPCYESPFRDAAELERVWQEPNEVGTESIHVAESEGCVVGVVAVTDEGSELELVDIDVTRACTPARMASFTASLKSWRRKTASGGSSDASLNATPLTGM